MNPISIELLDFNFKDIIPWDDVQLFTHKVNLVPLAREIALRVTYKEYENIVAELSSPTKELAASLGAIINWSHDSLYKRSYEQTIEVLHLQYNSDIESSLESILKHHVTTVDGVRISAEQFSQLVQEELSTFKKIFNLKLGTKAGLYQDSATNILGFQQHIVARAYKDSKELQEYIEENLSEYFTDGILNSENYIFTPNLLQRLNDSPAFQNFVWMCVPLFVMASIGQMH